MDRRIELLSALMKDDFHRTLPLTKLAQAVSLSVSRLHHLFKAETGTTPARYLHQLRMEHAKVLLDTTSLSIEQIIMHVGLRDRSHFEREFKKDYGLTPTQYKVTFRWLSH